MGNTFKAQPIKHTTSYLRGQVKEENKNARLDFNAEGTAMSSKQLACLVEVLFLKRGRFGATARCGRWRRGVMYRKWRIQGWVIAM